jgi:alkylhydroperoxidase/carboxymuconolactone decarboxylase family protein YurZ
MIAILATLGLWLQTEMQIDGCLDRGGKWDEHRQQCEGAAG